MKLIQAILSPTLFILYAADFPESRDSILATFADEILLCIIDKHEDPNTLQDHLNKVEK